MNDMDIICLDFIKKGNQLWFVDFLYGCLWKRDLSNGYQTLVKELPLNGRESYRAIYVTDEKVYLPPLFAEELLVFDLKTEQFSSYSIKNIVEKNKPNFIDIFEYKGFLYCTPMYGKGIVRIDTKNDQYDVFNLPKSILNDVEVERPRFRRGSIHRNLIYLATCSGNKVIIFDTDSCTYKEIAISDESDGYSVCCCTDEGILLVTYDNKKGILLDSEMRIVKVLELECQSEFVIDIVAGNKVLHMGCADDNKVSVIDMRDRRINLIDLCINKKNSIIEKQYLKNSFLFCAKYIDGKIWAYITKRKSLCIFNPEGRLEKEILFGEMLEEEKKRLNNRKNQKMQKVIAEEKGIISENATDSLMNFIEGIG